MKVTVQVKGSKGKDATQEWNTDKLVVIPQRRKIEWRRFVLLNMTSLDTVLCQLSPSATKVLLFVMCQVGYDCSAHLTYKNVCAATGLSIATVRRAAEELENHECLHRSRRTPGQAFDWCLNPDMVYRGKAVNHAKVIAQFREQQAGRSDRTHGADGAVV